MLRDLVIKTRSCRRFNQAVAVEKQTLVELVDLARLSASGMNKQPLKYLLSWEAEKNGKIFPHLGWARALTDWPGPAEGERPSAYIIILGDTAISESFGVDYGIAAQTIMLGAREKGLAGCMIGSAQKEPLRETLKAKFDGNMHISPGPTSQRSAISITITLRRRVQYGVIHFLMTGLRIKRVER